MNPSIVSGSRKHLVNQLIYFDEQFSVFFHQYFPEQGINRASMEKTVRRYLGTLESLLKQDDEKLLQSLNTITLLGSSVKLIYKEDGFEESFTVVFPTEIDPDRNRISFLSPIGKQLLFASAGDHLVLDTPVGKHDVQIGEVKFAYMGEFARD